MTSRQTNIPNLVRKYTFLACLIIAILAGLVVGYMEWPESKTPADALANAYGWTTLVLLVLGIVVAILNIELKKVTSFLVAVIALSLIRGEALKNPLTMVHPLLGFCAYYIINFIVAFAAPVAIIFAIKTIRVLARGE